jgi:hypothetical protein
LVFGATKESAGVTFTRFPCLSDNLDGLLGGGVTICLFADGLIALLVLAAPTIAAALITAEIITP